MKQKLNKKGFTITEILVVLGIFSIMSGLAMSLVFDSFKENFKLSSKTEHLTNIGLIQKLTLKVDKCSCQLAGKTFNSIKSDEVLSLKELREGCSEDSPLLATTDPTSLSENALKVKDIYIDSFTYTNKPNEYNAKLNIIDGSERPIPLILRFNTVPGSSAMKTINGCGSPPLSVPTNLKTTNGSKSCELTWDHSIGAGPIQYFVKYADASGHVDNGTEACLPYTTSNSCLVTGLTDGVTYYFVVKAKNETESTEYSFETSCKPGAFPEPPVDMTTVRGDTQCTIKWNPPPEETLPLIYNIYKSSTPGSYIKGEKACTTSSTECIVTGLKNGQTYYFSGTSTNTIGTGAFSSPEVICQPNFAPNKPVLIESYAFDSYCSIRWDPSTVGEEPIKYTVYNLDTKSIYSVDTKTKIPTCENLSSSTQICSIPGLTNGKEYNFEVKATNKIGSAISNTISCTPAIPPK